MLFIGDLPDGDVSVLFDYVAHNGVVTVWPDRVSTAPPGTITVISTPNISLISRQRRRSSLAFGGICCAGCCGWTRLIERITDGCCCCCIISPCCTAYLDRPSDRRSAHTAATDKSTAVVINAHIHHIFRRRRQGTKGVGVWFAR